MIEKGRWESGLAQTNPERPHWALRAGGWLIETLRPHLGWPVLIVCLLLAILPAWALGDNRTTELRDLQAGLDSAGPLAVLITWWLLGWRTPRRLENYRWFRIVMINLASLLIGLLLLSQFLIGWLPSGSELWQALWSNGWAALGGQMAADWSRTFVRFVLWWQGVQSGGASQDNLIFAAFAGLVFWIVGGLTAWLTRRYQQGLLAAAPVLWLVGLMLLYSTTGRSLMITGVLLAILLHLLLDQHAWVVRWQARGLDFSPSLFVDRILTVGAALTLLLLVAAIIPNWYITPLVVRYYQWTEPWQQGLEDAKDLLFPDLEGASRLRGGGLAGGLPNDFLLGAGGALGETVVMRIRTNDYVDQGMGPYMEQPPPPGHYTRGATFAVYDGHGWRNPPDLARQTYDANAHWDNRELQGRRTLVQNISLTFNTSILYGAPEQWEPSLPYEAELRADGDVVALWARERNYTIVSAIPAVSAEQLAATPAWGPEQPLPDGYEIHLQLPDTITDRTRQLAAELTANQPSAFAKAHAIEMHLRTLAYDLTVPEPPQDVVDVADYFLFDLQRGYCDYYATAFIVLARLAGLPARFATGYAVGYWDEIDQVWVVTEAEAHSWPEVYFPQYGWIPFEPTAGRSELTRIGLPETSSAPSVSSAPNPIPIEEPQARWNWQMLFWLLPLGLLVWGVIILLQHWRTRREEPWPALLRWGARLGRPISGGETVLEYGGGLADHLTNRPSREPDTNRVAAREVRALSDAVNTLQYGPDPQRATATVQATEHWQRLRGYLPRLRRRG